MIKQFLIDDTLVRVPESNIERYYYLGDECHHKLGT
jgi:hypothetical protein